MPFGSVVSLKVWKYMLGKYVLRFISLLPYLRFKLLVPPSPFDSLLLGAVGNGFFNGHVLEVNGFSG